ncbi:hypothetical protein F1559_002301 [Cyanidiococcus yangmingshanensis]|uniref:RING-type domain-containing protein n=1 Tax=Cyanidiococcus yangmingshanensis TaxID=2690220 RepID=A0A7J7IDW2_9RHOD|nr:hypothetical protein F1559_002301 [Cyanidiococcus yangmingshanensis]
MLTDKLFANHSIIKAFAIQDVPQKHGVVAKKMPAVRRVLRDQIRRSRNAFSSSAANEQAKLDALRNFLDEVTAADVDSLFRRGEWDWVIGAVAAIIWEGRIECTERAAAALARTSRRLFSSQHSQSRFLCLGVTVSPITNDAQASRFLRFAAFARARVIVVPALLRRLFTFAMSSEEPQFIAQSPLWDALVTYTDQAHCEHYSSDGHVPLSVSLERLAQSLVCFARERDRVSLGILLDQTFALWSSISTESLGWTAPRPWMLHASEPVQSVFMPHRTPCLERQSDVALASAITVIASLLDDVALTADMRREMMRQMAAASLPLRIDAELLCLDTSPLVPCLSDWLFDSMVSKVADEPYFACQILLKHWNLGGSTQSACQQFAVNSTRIPDLVRALTVRFLPLTPSHCEPAACTLLELAHSEDAVKHLTNKDFESWFFIAALMLQDTARDCSRQGHDASSGTARRTQLPGSLSETRAHGYGDALLRAIVPVFSGTGLRWLLFFYMARYRCRDALCSWLQLCDQVKVGEFFQVAAEQYDRVWSDSVPDILRSAQATLSSYRQRNPNLDIEKAQGTIRDALYSAASLIERRITDRRGTDAMQCPEDERVSLQATAPSMMDDVRSGPCAWALAMLIYTLGPRALADQSISGTISSVLRTVPAEAFLTLSILHGLMNDEMLRQTRRATEAELDCERLHARHADDRKTLMERLYEIEAEKHNLEQNLTCMVCFDQLRAPLALVPCGHVLCKVCFVALTAEHRIHLCPTCRQAFDPLAAISIHLV